MNTETLRDAGAACTEFLLANADEDWTVRPPDLEWTVAEVVAHIANTLLWYAVDFAGGKTELSTTDITVGATAEPRELVRSVSATVTLLSAVVTQSASDARGWHPRGLADASGFAAMACDELFVHTSDAARGLGVAFTAPAPATEATLRRLFPWAPEGGDPWQVLLWANGRIALPDRPRLEKWRWHCAPLSEWDGQMPG
ncbi:maleylpyruvate isomerase family mycothiol-dependent enzyme [Saccharomonospora sp. NPDC046836]|uniref:maleylpyruvate isomerase family mycothiol-dependent enzyme n=1 Tax=Saccharomonospora sp. NPDC046836 TaxID=3156921 RepID=UPI0033FFE1BC